MKKRKRLCFLILPLITLILECLPYGAVCIIFSLVGGLITLSLAAELLLLQFAVKGKS